MIQICLAWRRYMPSISLDTQLFGIVKQPFHIFAFELHSVRITEIRPGVPQIEIHSVLLCSLVDPFQIPDVLRLGQRNNTTPSARNDNERRSFGGSSTVISR